MKEKILLSVLCLSIIASSFAQVTGSFTVGGVIGNYYPVTFYDGGWSQNIATELEVGRSEVHTNSSWRGSLSAKFRFHTNGWGNGSDFIEADINQNRSGVAPAISDFVGGWKDASLGNSDNKVIIWLRGGNTTYFYKANTTVTPVIYDGVTNSLPFQESGGPQHSFKTSADAYVNKQGITLSSVYVTGNYINYFSGNVGIGTTDPKEYKLAVNGAAIFTKVQVKATGNPWPDYVFNSNYNLRSLPSLETFIKENNHLPDAPSAKEVERKGLDLGETQAMLLKKIEELTLYVIEQDKKIKNLEKHIKH